MAFDFHLVLPHPFKLNLNHFRGKYREEWNKFMIFVCWTIHPISRTSFHENLEQNQSTLQFPNLLHIIPKNYFLLWYFLLIYFIFHFVFLIKQNNRFLCTITDDAWKMLIKQFDNTNQKNQSIKKSYRK